VDPFFDAVLYGFQRAAVLVGPVHPPIGPSSLGSVGETDRWVDTSPSVLSSTLPSIFDISVPHPVAAQLVGKRPRQIWNTRRKRKCPRSPLPIPYLSSFILPSASCASSRAMFQSLAPEQGVNLAIRVGECYFRIALGKSVRSFHSSQERAVSRLFDFPETVAMVDSTSGSDVRKVTNRVILLHGARQAAAAAAAAAS